MGQQTAIEWTDHTHNFWYGCKKVSQGCKFCYAERDMTKYGRDFHTVTRAKGFDKPLSWKDPAKVFVNSWSDFFIEDADDWRGDAWDIIRRTPHLIYQILTKRPEHVMDRLPTDWGKGYPNVWLGVSVESREAAHRLGELAEVPAALRFISAEPLLAPWYPEAYPQWMAAYQWIIIGGESGPSARPMEASWAAGILHAARDMGLAVFFKQMGGTKRIGGHWGGNELYGHTYHEFPVTAARQLELFS